MKYLPSPSDPRPDGFKYLRIIKDNLLEAPPIFNIIQQNSGSSNKEMYEVFNMGCRMEIYCDAADAGIMISAAKEFNIDAQVIGRVEAAVKKELIIKLKNEEIVY
jgi:phosphoribosylformylglycinamidine cyclo-ligase